MQLVTWIPWLGAAVLAGVAATLLTYQWHTRSGVARGSGHANWKRDAFLLCTLAVLSLPTIVLAVALALAAFS